jgi:Na+/melibiose symporter-like transporter
MGITDLWLPILVSAAVCWVMSAIIWAALKYHNRDYKRTADEDSVRAALKGNEPGYYLLPYCLDPNELKNPEVKQKYEEGPLAYITMLPNGVPAMGGKLISMFIYFAIVGVLCAYFVSRTLGPDADYLAVFRVAGTVAFVANSFAIVPESIWFGRPWAMTIKNIVDALIYGLLTGGVFGWLA